LDLEYQIRGYQIRGLSCEFNNFSVFWPDPGSVNRDMAVRAAEPGDWKIKTKPLPEQHSVVEYGQQFSKV